MTEPDNFEEDLFADLYTDEDNTQKAAPPQTEVTVESTEQPEVKPEADENGEPNGEADEQAYKDEQEMDDDIDFNLGGGESNYDSPAAQEQHGPGIKEDG